MSILWLEGGELYDRIQQKQYYPEQEACKSAARDEPHS